MSEKKWVIRKRHGIWWAEGPFGFLATGMTFTAVCEHVRDLDLVLRGWR